MKSVVPAIFFFISISFSFAQLNTTFIINTSQDRHSISKYIYGSNGQSADEDENITARRLGGNRLTGYNWENNASNAGSDWYHSSDDYLPSVSGIPLNQYSVPNIVYQSFHDTSVAMNCYSLLTLPMAGYVARDTYGTVSVAETAPSLRFCSVINRKGSAFNLFPDTTDQNIYIDECLNNLIHQNGLSTSSNGIRGYSMDNEYALWNSTHPRIHPLQPTISEVINKSIDLAGTIKSMDSNAEVFGPADYGYASFLNFQTSPDWNNYSSYGNFINVYLNGMKHASDSIGFRLLDVADVHWYPEAQGINNQGTLERVVGGSNDRGVAIARMQCPRTLWDSSYVENSWIGQYFSPCVYIHALKKGIAIYYPSTKLAFTEFDYGGSNHISGGIAQADVLGIFGKYDVYMGTHWGPLDDYVSTAYKIFRNYDGSNSSFGDLSIYSSTNDIANSSIYTSLESADTSRMHIILINKNYDSTMTANIQINSTTNFISATTWGFDSSSTSIFSLSSINTITANHITKTIPPLTVLHLIVTSNSSTSINDLETSDAIKIYPNPATDKISIQSALPGDKIISVENVLGEQLSILNSSREKCDLNISDLCPGIYFVKIRMENYFITKRFLKVN